MNNVVLVCKVMLKQEVRMMETLGGNAKGNYNGKLFLNYALVVIRNKIT